jgi:hypothetical protein
MKSRKRTAHLARQNKSVWVWTLSSFSLLLLSRAAETQQAIAPQPQSAATTEPVWEQTQTNQFDVFAPGGTTPIVGLDQPFQIGPVTARPHFLYRFFYATGLPSRNFPRALRLKLARIGRWITRPRCDFIPTTVSRTSLTTPSH